MHTQPQVKASEQGVWTRDALHYVPYLTFYEFLYSKVSLVHFFTIYTLYIFVL